MGGKRVLYSLAKLILILSVVLVSGIGSARTQIVIAAPFHAGGDLLNGETRPIVYPVSSQKDVNVKLQITGAGGSGDVDLTITDGSGAKVFEGTILDGETLWTTVTLKPTNNTFSLTNDSGVDLEFDLWVYEVGTAPYSWSGTSRGTGSWRSRIDLSFPASGLYQFNWGLASGRFQFHLDGEYIQKTVEVTGTVVSYYVAAGLHSLRIEPDPDQAETAWSVDISGPGAGTDSLPYTKTGGHLWGSPGVFGEEWLPLSLSAATDVNLKLTLAGGSDDAMDVLLYGAGGATPLYTVSDVYGGETVWWTTDLPPGVSRVKLVADPGNSGSLTYDLTVRAAPTGTASWSGTSRGSSGNNSQVTFEVAAAGLYDLNYDVGPGRYQFLVNPAPHIQKTVEVSGTVRYYLPAGTHTVTVVQDTDTSSTGWSLEVAATGLANDSLPYTKSGGMLGGMGNDFGVEWLPLGVSSAAAGAANFKLALAGDWADGVKAYLYQGGTPVYTSPVVYGGETFWWTADLAAGVNQVKVAAEGGNGAPLQYDLTVDALPSPTCSWSGVADDGGGNSVAQVNVLSTATYHVTLDTPEGFGQVIVDGDLSAAGGLSVQSSGHMAEFDIQLSAGLHSFEVEQSTTFSKTTWTITVATTTAGAQIGHFAGSLGPGQQADPQLPLPGTQSKEVNFRVIAGGGDLDLSIQDGAGGSAFSGTVLDGETLWGTITLKPGQNTFALTNNGATTVDYDLTVFEIGAPEYTWDGLGDAAGLHSHIRLTFPANGLYTFDLGVDSGRYQFLLDGDYIQKTVESGTVVTFYVPAGTHDLYLDQDTTTGADWDITISAPGLANDTLPYTKAGGQIGGAGNDFAVEWLPLGLAAPTKVNLRMNLTSAGSEQAQVQILDSSDAEITSAVVRDSEIYWMTFDLPAGTSRVKITADPGNAGPLAYELTVGALPGPAYTWDGLGDAAGLNSHIRVTFPSDGLYTFDLGVDSGRYQFLLDDGSIQPTGADDTQVAWALPSVVASRRHIQKTVENDTEVTYYLTAGTHSLYIDQDATLGADWDIVITGPGAANDTLPYTKAGGEIGGTGNDFAVEWLPLGSSSSVAANFGITLTGALSDGLRAYLYQESTAVYTTPVVYGEETFWWTTDLASGVNLIELRTESGNDDPLSYELAIHSIPVVRNTTPYTLSGVSKGVGANSKVELQLPVSGSYHVRMDMAAGYANLYIDQMVATSGMRSQQSSTEYDLDLSEGSYLLTVVQSAFYEKTEWTVTISTDEIGLYYIYLPVVARNYP